MRRIAARHATHSRAQGDLLQWLTHLAKVPRAHGAVPRQAHQAAENPNVSFQSPLLLTHTLSLIPRSFSLSRTTLHPSLPPCIPCLAVCLSVCMRVRRYSARLASQPACLLSEGYGR